MDEGTNGLLRREAIYQCLNIRGLSDNTKEGGSLSFQCFWITALSLLKESVMVTSASIIKCLWL